MAFFLNQVLNQDLNAYLKQFHLSEGGEFSYKKDCSFLHSVLMYGFVSAEARRGKRELCGYLRNHPSLKSYHWLARDLTQGPYGVRWPWKSSIFAISGSEFSCQLQKPRGDYQYPTVPSLGTLLTPHVMYSIPASLLLENAPEMLVDGRVIVCRSLSSWLGWMERRQNTKYRSANVVKKLSILEKIHIKAV